jgi:hypothetical protein
MTSHADEPCARRRCSRSRARSTSAGLCNFGWCSSPREVVTGYAAINRAISKSTVRAAIREVDCRPRRSAGRCVSVPTHRSANPRQARTRQRSVPRGSSERAHDEPAAVIQLAARPALHYSALQRTRNEREQCDMEKTAQTTIRMTEAEREAWEAAARADGRTLSAWIVRRCNGQPTTAPELPPPASAKRKAR